jgi:hypothetical protein
MIIIKHIDHELIDADSKCGEGVKIGSATTIGFLAMNIEGAIRIRYSPDLNGSEAIKIVKDQIKSVAKQIG